MALVAGLGIAASSQAAIKDSVTFTDVEVTQTANLGAGTFRLHNFTNTGYTLGRIDFSGTVEEINGVTNDFGSENRVRVMFPDGRFKDVQFTTTLGYEGQLAFSGSFEVATGATTPYSGPWAFSFVNTFNDAGDNDQEADAKVTVTFNLTDETVTPPTPPATLGTFGPFGTQATFTTQSHNDGGAVRWYKVILSEPINGTRFLDIDTETSALTPDNDLEIALYDSNGTMLVTDDDDGNAFMSQLSFGPGGGSRTAEGTGVAYNGRDGSLAAGTYYLAVGGFNSIFTNGFTVTSDSVDTGTAVIRMRADGVVSTNQPPVLGAIGNKTGAINQLLTFQATATDPENQTLSFYLANAPAGATMDAATGVFTWTPTSGGTFNVGVVVVDSAGGFDSELFTIEIGGSNDETINPSVITVTQGEELSGDLSSLTASDDSYYVIISSATTLQGEIIFDGDFASNPGVSLEFKVEANAARGGLSQAIWFWNYEIGGYENKSGIVASATDLTTTITTSNMSYVSGTGAVKARIRWTPINDEDPSQDGWALNTDLVSWKLSH